AHARPPAGAEHPAGGGGGQGQVQQQAGLVDRPLDGHGAAPVGPGDGEGVFPHGRVAGPRRGGGGASHRHPSSPPSISTLDVLGGEVGPGGAEEHHDEDGLHGGAPADVAPEHGGADQVHERQPVVGGQVRLERRGRVQQVEHLGGDQRGQGAEGGGQGRVGDGGGEQGHRRHPEHRPGDVGDGDGGPPGGVLGGDGLARHRRQR